MLAWAMLATIVAFWLAALLVIERGERREDDLYGQKLRAMAEERAEDYRSRAETHWERARELAADVGRAHGETRELRRRFRWVLREARQWKRVAVAAGWERSWGRDPRAVADRATLAALRKPS